MPRITTNIALPKKMTKKINVLYGEERKGDKKKRKIEAPEHDRDRLTAQARSQ